MKKFPSLSLTFAERDGHQILIDAAFRLNETSAASRRLVVDPPRGRYLHAVCILMLLAKYQGEDFADRSGAILFRNKKDTPTWIKALGISFGRGVQEDFFSGYFSSLHFLSASRGSAHNKQNKAAGKGVPPSAKYLTRQLPLQNLNFLKAGHNSAGDKLPAMKGEELVVLAERLERQESEKPGGWEAIVPEIVAATVKDRPLKIPLNVEMDLSVKADGGEPVLLTTHWRALNEDVRRAIKGKALGGDWYVVCVVPNWVADWKPVFCEAITQHHAKVRIAFQAASSADACPAIRAQLRINSSRVNEKNYAAVVAHIQTKIEDMKTEMSYWVKEVQRQSGRGQNSAGAFEFFESYLNHPLMAILAVPGAAKRTVPVAPSGTWCILGFYPFYKRSTEKCCSVYLNSESPVLNFYYNTILDLFERGPKDGYLKKVDLLKRQSGRKAKTSAGLA